MKLWKYLVSSALVTLNCPGVELVRDGKPCAEIVISENADSAVKSAAADLQTHLKKISGAVLPVVTPEKARSQNLICVGESECTRKAGYKLPDFKRSGYDVLVKGNLVILAGPEKRPQTTPQKKEKASGFECPESRFFALSGQEDDCGAAHAVTAFLEYLGVRFYAPYEGGTVIPEGKTISVPEFRETREAAFARRIYRADALKNDPDTVAWFRHLKCGSSLDPVAVLPLAEVLNNCTSVPDEWIARDAQGRAMLTDDGCFFPRFSQPGLQQECAKYIRQLFDSDPSIRRLQLVLPALRGKQDNGDLKTWLTKTVYPQPVESDIMFSFYSAVAREVEKTHPDRILICQPPGKNSLPSPAILKAVPKNLRILPCGQGATLYAAEPTRTQYLGKLSTLAKLPGGGEMQQVEWWNEPGCPGVPAQGFWFMRALQQVRRAQRSVIDGFVMDAGLDPRPSSSRLADVPMTHLMLYVNSKLLWDPDLDLDALLDEYYRLWFGPAADAMKSFFIFAQNLADRPARRSILATDGQFQPEDVPVWFELLARAKAKTPDGSVFRDRIEALEKSCAGLKTVFGHLTAELPEVQGTPVPVETVADGDLSKYRNWKTLPGGKKNARTEFALAASDDRQRLFVAFRCYEPDMERLKKVRLTPDSPALDGADHVRFSFLLPMRGRYFVSVDPDGNFSSFTADPEDLALVGSPHGWNPSIFTSAKRYDDRWEAEMEIVVNNLGKLPDYGAPWEIGVERRWINGHVKDSSELAARFVMPKTNSAGQPVTVNYGVMIRHGNEPAESVYTVKRASGPVDLSAAWNSPVWKDIPELKLQWETIYHKSQSKFLPEPRAKIQYDDQYLYVLYQVSDRFVRGTFKNDQDMVCLDSCMEIFIQPVRNAPYYNFECNCIGTLLLYEAAQQPNKTIRFTRIPPEDLKQIKRFSTLPRDLSGELAEPVVWRLGLQIPLDFFARRRNIKLPVSGQVWYFNVYKCADWTSNSRWLMWNKNQTFHEPAGFGRMIFE
ncbi:MAG: hypothetical protein IJS14_01470 [Lentisphaeria bacterium]|nr:hypothetical protein [Lentisphaeria bacterium]